MLNVFGKQQLLNGYSSSYGNNVFSERQIKNEYIILITFNDQL